MTTERLIAKNDELFRHLYKRSAETTHGGGRDGYPRAGLLSREKITGMLRKMLR